MTADLDSRFRIYEKRIYTAGLSEARASPCK